MAQGYQKKMAQNVSATKDVRAGGNALWGEARKSESNYSNTTTQKKTEKLTAVHKCGFKQKLLLLKG